MNWFENRELLIATQHGKEKAIAPLLEQAFSLRCSLPQAFDSDQFGTFSGEIERTFSAHETARLKGREAARIASSDLVLSSEGSFGSHPQLYFLPLNTELILLQDFKNKFEILVSESTTETNYAAAEIASENDLFKFAERIGFPAHAIILKNCAKGFAACIKGIHTAEELRAGFHSISAQFGAVYAETDMRAMHNPMRMQAIKKACEKLVVRMQTCCAQCGLPGFGEISFTPGLPCSWCNEPTQLPMQRVLSCAHCEHTLHEAINPDNVADPMHCFHCIP